MKRRLTLTPAWRRRLRRVRWGSLRRETPVSHRWGYDRGTPVDRRLIEDFLTENSDAVRGHVLEVKDPRYTDRFGRDVTASDVVDIDASNPQATIVADLSERGSLPAGRFDCAIVTQTMMYVPDPFAAVANLWQSLAPGGTLLVTVASIIRVDPDADQIDRWRITPPGFRQLVDRECPDADVEIGGRGNLVAAIAFLQGMATEELREEELTRHDPSYPVITVAAIRRPERRPETQAERSPR